MKEDQDQDHVPALSTMPYDTCSLSCPNLQSSHQEQVAIPREQVFGQQGQEEVTTVKWMSSKIRIMRKMIGEDPRISLNIKQGISQVSPQDQAQSNHECSSSNGNNSPTPFTGIIRVCSNCSTTKTPLWRSGPQGPKSLCNACGIRQMKARRAMRAAAAAAASAVGGGLVPASAPKKVVKERSEVDRTVPFKKRFKIATPSISASPKKKLLFDDVKIALSKKLAFNQAFPQEEKDAAILLMALSYGLIHG